ncbi:hypothetical protein [Beijerinckia indica]|uniref:hypothetical protein n=1 Tax=Beijerinckia indica TaxID=533 RepID=UPI0002FE7689|nr:hypothetical protein [Beijerinckia indica]
MEVCLSEALLGTTPHKSVLANADRVTTLAHFIRPEKPWPSLVGAFLGDVAGVVVVQLCLLLIIIRSCS